MDDLIILPIVIIILAFLGILGLIVYWVEGMNDNDGVEDESKEINDEKDDEE